MLIRFADFLRFSKVSKLLPVLIFIMRQRTHNPKYRINESDSNESIQALSGQTQIAMGITHEKNNMTTRLRDS